MYLNIHLTVVVYDLLSSYGKQSANERMAFKFGIMYIHHMLTWYLCIYLVTRIKAVKQCVESNTNGDAVGTSERSRSMHIHGVPIVNGG